MQSVLQTVEQSSYLKFKDGKKIAKDFLPKPTLSDLTVNTYFYL